MGKHSKPRGFWKDKTNVENEFWSFVEAHAGVEVNCTYVRNHYRSLGESIYTLYGGFKPFAEEIGYTYKQLKSWSAERVKAEFLQLLKDDEDISSKNLTENHYALYGAIVRFFGGVKNLCMELGVPYTPIPNGRARYWTAERVAEEYLELYNAGEDVSAKGIQKLSDPVYCRIREYFGGVAGICEYLGIDYDSVALHKQMWTKESVLNGVTSYLEELGEGEVVTCHIKEHAEELYTAIKNCYGSFKTFSKETNIPVIYQRGNMWTKEKLIKMIQERVKQGLPVNSTVFSKSLHKNIRREVGSFKNLITLAGLDYEELKAKPNYKELYATDAHGAKSLITATLGNKFEELLGQLFVDIQKPFTKYHTGVSGCEPDFIFSDAHWADAKLSVTTDTVSMRKKYLGHCKKLTVFHLLGDRDYTSVLVDGTERVNIFAYIRVQPEYIQNKYIPLFTLLEELAGDIKAVA